MPTYLCIQRSLTKSTESEPPSPSKMQDMYAAFGAWQAKFSEHIVDMGGKLGDGKLLTHEAQADGPFVEVKELVGGYMILSATDLAQAEEVARAFPGLVRPGSGVEVIEIHKP